MGGRGGGSPASRQGPAASAESLTVDNSTTGRLGRANTRAEARQALSGLSASELKAVANDLGMRGQGSLSKATLTDSIIEFTVGNRINSQAIRGL